MSRYIGCNLMWKVLFNWCTFNQLKFFRFLIRVVLFCSCSGCIHIPSCNFKDEEWKTIIHSTMVHLKVFVCMRSFLGNFSFFILINKFGYSIYTIIGSILYINLTLSKIKLKWEGIDVIHCLCNLSLSTVVSWQEYSVDTSFGFIFMVKEFTSLCNDNNCLIYYLL